MIPAGYCTTESPAMSQLRLSLAECPGSLLDQSVRDLLWTTWK